MDAPPVRYVTTDDGYNIAYTVQGHSDPWVIVPPGFHHLQVALEEPSMRAWVEGLAERFQLVRYDTRGQGLSTRGLPASHTISDHTLDLQAVLDRLELPPVILHGIGSSAHVVVRFAAQHPERVRALVLVHCSVTSAPWPRTLMNLLAGADWDEFLRTMTTMSRTQEEGRTSRERLRQMVNQADFARKFHAYQASNISEDLARLQMPALVLRLRELERPTREESAAVAALVPNARLAEIEGSMGPWFWGDFDSAIPLIEDFLSEIPASREALPEALSGLPAILSPREIEVLRLLAAGRSNQQIADQLVISLNTVRRHVSNIFDKTGATNRAQAAVYAKDHALA